jgi:hypothetical protein
VAEQELKLWEREEHDDLRLKRGLETLMSRESDLNNRKATLAVERKDMEEARTGVLACELAADIRDISLNSREGELVDTEKWLVERDK